MIIKTDKTKGANKRNYTRADNGFILDDRLSLKAKAILLYFLSKREDWNPVAVDVTRYCRDSKTSVNSGMKELERYGYLVRKRTRTPDGKFGYVATIYELPLAENPGAVEPRTDVPPSVEPRQESPGEITTERTTTDRATSEEQLGERSPSKEDVRQRIEAVLALGNLRSVLDSTERLEFGSEREKAKAELETLFVELNIPLSSDLLDRIEMTSAVLDRRDRWAALVALVQDRADLAGRGAL